MAKHKPSVGWHTHKFGVYPYAAVTTASTTDLKIAFFPKRDEAGFSFTLTRKMARMLARRINQCLDDTK